MSKQVIVKRNTANFTYEGTFDITDDVANALLEEGIVRVLQGSVLGGWEKSIAYPGKGVKRPEGFKRNSIEFNDDNVAALKKAIMGAEVEVGRNEKDEPIMADLGATAVVVTKYDGPEAAVPKYAREKEFITNYLKNPAFTIEGFATKRAIATPSEPWEEDVAFLASVKDWLTAKLKEQATEE